MIYASNVGDCRAVLCRGGVAIDLTSDHRFSRTDERTRIINAGGGNVLPRMSAFCFSHILLVISRRVMRHDNIKGVMIR